jgi:hypothetical protein
VRQTPSAGPRQKKGADIESLLQNSIFKYDQASGHDFSRAKRGGKGNLGFSPCNLVFSYLQFRSG